MSTQDCKDFLKTISGQYNHKNQNWKRVQKEKSPAGEVRLFRNDAGEEIWLLEKANQTIEVYQPPTQNNLVAPVVAPTQGLTQRETFFINMISSEDKKVRSKALHGSNLPLTEAMTTACLGVKDTKVKSFVAEHATLTTESFLILAKEKSKVITEALKKNSSFFQMPWDEKLKKVIISKHFEKHVSHSGFQMSEVEVSEFVKASIRNYSYERTEFLMALIKNKKFTFSTSDIENLLETKSRVCGDIVRFRYQPDVSKLPELLENIDYGSYLIARVDLPITPEMISKTIKKFHTLDEVWLSALSREDYMPSRWELAAGLRFDFGHFGTGVSDGFKSRIVEWKARQEKIELVEVFGEVKTSTIKKRAL